MEPIASSPHSDEAKLSCGPIETLPDSLLALIFAYLPLKERHQLCLVSSKWSAASRIPWTDVTFLSLNAIPRTVVNPNLGLCPTVKTLEATDLIVLLVKKQGLSINENVQTMALRNTNLGLSGLACGENESIYCDVMFSFHDHFERFPKLNELILHNVGFTLVRKEDDDASKDSFRDFGYCKPLAMPDVTAASLRRSVVSDSAANTCGVYAEVVFRGMQNLEWLSLEGPLTCLYGNFDLPRLHELCLINADSSKPLDKKVVSNRFPKLEVLICSSDFNVDTKSLTQLLTVNLPLRLLVIAAERWTVDLQQEFGLAVPLQMPAVQLPVTLPARKLLADSNPVSQSRLPLLQIFVGGDFTEFVRFTLPPSDVAKFCRIYCPMPEYLAKSKVAEIFKDVFVAKIIREGPENGPMPWGRPHKMELFFSTEPLLFC